MLKFAFIALLAVSASACTYKSERVVAPAPSTTTQRSTTVTSDPAQPAVTTTTTTTAPSR